MRSVYSQYAFRLLSICATSILNMLYVYLQYAWRFVRRALRSLSIYMSYSHIHNTNNMYSYNRLMLHVFYRHLRYHTALQSLNRKINNDMYSNNYRRTVASVPYKSFTFRPFKSSLNHVYRCINTTYWILFVNKR